MPAIAGTTSACTLIAGFEGLRLTAYQDQGGVWTVGYGATGPGIGPGTIWTQAQAQADLSRRVGQCRHVLQALVTVPLEDGQWDALTSLGYNIGLGAVEHSTLLRLLNAGDTAGAADQFLVWNHVAGKPNDGLTRRRIAERHVFLGTTGTGVA